MWKLFKGILGDELYNQRKIIYCQANRRDAEGIQEVAKING